MKQTKAHQGNDDNDGKPVQRDEDFMQPLKINLLVLCKFFHTTHIIGATYEVQLK